MSLFKYFSTGILCLLSSTLCGQIVTNGSMEGPIGTRTPISWSSCLASSTVDTQPGVWGMTRPAQDGNTYIDMVCRGPNYPNEGTCEELAQLLNTPLEAGKCYRLEMYMAFAPDFGVEEFRNPVDVRVSTGALFCTIDETIATFESIGHEEWRRYVSYFTTRQDLNAIWLEAQYTDMPIYFGHVLVDNLSITEVEDPEPQTLAICADGVASLEAYLAMDADNVQWSTGENSPVIEVSEAGSYTATITLGDCQFTQEFEVSSQETPDITLTTETSMCPGDQIVLDATTVGASYQWQDRSSQPTLTVNEPGTYSVEVTIGNCTSSFSVNLITGDCEAVLEMPNAFTPNQDGTNDLFVPIEIKNIVQMSTVIYSRWGDQVFTSNHLQIEWDGLLPNKYPAPAATYYWRVTFTDLYGETHDQKGTVSILR